MSETEFGVGAQLTVTVDSRSLAEARAEVEGEFDDIPVGVTGGAGGALAADGGAAGAMGGTGLAALRDELGDQTDILEDIYDELDEMAGMGAGMGVGGGADGGGGVLETFGLASLLSAGGGKLAGALGGGGALTMLGAGGAGIATGLAGGRLLDEFTPLYDWAAEGGEQARDLPGGEMAGDAAQFLPSLSVASMLRPTWNGDFDQAWDNFNTVWERRVNILQNVSDSGRSPGALSMFSDDTIQKTLREKVRSGEISEDRAQEMADKYDVELSVSEDARETAQQWRQAAKEFQNLDISAPPWMSQLGRLFGIDIGGGGEDSPGAEPTPQMKDDARRIAASPGTAAEKRHAAGWVGDQPETGSNPETRRIMRSATTAAEKRHAAGWVGDQQSTGNRAAEKRQQGQRVDVSVANEIKPELQLRNGRELERFLRNPERYISRKLNIRGRR